MIHLNPKHANIILTILQKYPYQFYAYGSRTTDQYRPTSDLDLCFKESIPFVTLALLQEEFEESNLPFEVDIHDFNKLDPAFKAQISSNLILFLAHNII